MRSTCVRRTGVFTGVQGSVTARFAMPAGYTFEGDAMLKTPLSQMLIPASSAGWKPTVGRW